MTNTTTEITVPAASTQVVVQTVLTGAWKTFRQGTGAVILTMTLALLTDWTTGAFGGELPTLTDLRILGFLALAFGIGFIAAVLSFVQNTWFTKTLPAGTEVKAEITPLPK
jgi:hypothetical protein